MNNLIKAIRLKTTNTEVFETPSFRSFSFWQQSFICFWMFSLIGHYLEIIWTRVLHLITSNSLWIPKTPTVVPLAVPYGLGAVTIILVIYPLMKRYKLHPVIVFILSTIITSAVEYMCAVFNTLTFGHNPFWDYSDRLLNVNGYICLSNSLLFGVVAMFFIYFILPSFEKALKSLTSSQLNIIFWILLSSYGMDLIYTTWL